MTTEILVIGAAWVTASGAVVGLIMTWRKNGKSQAKRDERIKLNQENIMKTLDDKDEGLAALNRKMNSVTNHCAIVSTGLTERVKAAERDIGEIKHRRSRG